MYAMAKRTGLSAQGLGKVEQGRREPAWSTVQLVAEVLDLPLDEFRNPALALREYEPAPKRGRPKKPPASVQGEPVPEAGEGKAGKKRGK